MKHTQRIKVIKVTINDAESMKGQDWYVSDCFQTVDGVNWGSSGVSGSPSGAKNYIPRLNKWDPEWMQQETIKKAQAEFESDLASLRLHGEPKIDPRSCAMHFASIAVVEIDIVTTYNVAFEIPLRSL